MGILTPSTPTPTSKPTKSPIVEEFEYKTAVEDNKKTSYRNLLSHVVGSSWTSVYYAQQLSDDDEPTSQDVGLDATYQQYIKISDFELKVNSPLSESQNQESNEFEVTGEATIYPPAIPNVGDMFVADVGDGREGLFSVTNAERLTILKETCYSISYTLVDYADDERLADLELKTIKRTHFIKKLLQHDTNPIVVDDEYNKYLLLAQIRPKIIGNYLARFFDKSNRTLLVPAQKFPTYDPFIIKFIKSFTETTDNKYLKEIKHYSVDLPGINTPITVWDAIIRHYENLLPLTNQKLGIVNKSVFKTIPQYDGVYYTKVQDVVYPTDINDLSLGSTMFQVDTEIKEMFDSGVISDTSTLSSDYTNSDSGNVKIKPVASDEFYVFSQAFYFGVREDMSKLELLVTDALDGNTLDQKVLYDLSKSISNWTLLDQFYYTPVILLLIKMVIHGL